MIKYNVLYSFHIIENIETNKICVFKNTPFLNDVLI